MKICVITPRWDITGVPLAQRRFALALAAAGHDVDLIIGRKDADLTIPLSPGVNLVVWDARGVRAMWWPIVRYLRQVQPEIVFSAEDHLNGAVLLAAVFARSKAKISGSSRVPPSDSYSNRPGSKKWVRKQLMRLAAKRADALTCVSKDMVTSYRRFFPNGTHQHVYNIVDDATSRQRAMEPVDHEWFQDGAAPVVVGAGTLTGRKNFRLLVDAMGEIARRNRYVRLAIFGEGYRRSELEEQIERLGIGDRTWLPGRVENPLSFFSRANVMALSSYAEGMPNVLVEGMMCGCTPVATDCPTGPWELLGDNRVGHLVPMDDPIAMADAIERALDAPTPLMTLQEAVAPFLEEAVIARHFEVLGLKV